MVQFTLDTFTIVSENHTDSHFWSSGGLQDMAGEIKVHEPACLEEADVLVFCCFFAEKCIR